MVFERDEICLLLEDFDCGKVYVLGKLVEEEVYFGNIFVFDYNIFRLLWYIVVFLGFILIFFVWDVVFGLERVVRWGKGGVILVS